MHCSCRHDNMLNSYLVWFSKTLRGEVAKRRSHIWMTGMRSSSEASTNWVATSGCHSIPEQCICNNHTTHRMNNDQHLAPAG